MSLADGLGRFAAWVATQPLPEDKLAQANDETEAPEHDGIVTALGVDGREMTRYILHIGLHKTGTSSLQAYLSSRRQMLLEHGVDFPLVGRVPQGSQAHRHVVAWFRGQTSEYPPGFGDQVPGGLTECETCILSSEDFYFCSGETDRRDRPALGSDIDVICYLREPVSHVVSMYKEHLKRPVSEFAAGIHREVPRRDAVGHAVSAIIPTAGTSLTGAGISGWPRHPTGVRA